MIVTSVIHFIAGALFTWGLALDMKVGDSKLGRHLMSFVVGLLVIWWLIIGGE